MYLRCAESILFNTHKVPVCLYKFDLFLLILQETYIESTKIYELKEANSKSHY